MSDASPGPAASIPQRRTSLARFWSVVLVAGIALLVCGTRAHAAASELRNTCPYLGLKKTWHYKNESGSTWASISRCRYDAFGYRDWSNVEWVKLIWSWE
jgi:hypothetical protein